MRARGIVLGIVLLTITVAMTIAAPRKYPFQPASAEHLWLWATSTPNPDAMQWWEFDAIRDGYVYYHIQQYHGWECFRVRTDEAAGNLPQVIQAMRAEDTHVVRGDWVVPAFERWEADGGNAIDLLHSIDEGRRQQILARTDNPTLVLAGVELTRRNFEITYSKAQRYGWNIAFECAFLLGFIAWVLWPWLRRRGLWAYAFHLASAPFLFFLPYYCGYGIWAYTTYYGDGGILYTGMIRWFDWDRNGLRHDVEQFLGVNLPDIQSLSDVLIPLNQLYTPEMDMFVYGGPPPLLTLGIGLIIFAAIVSVGYALRRLTSAE